MRQQHQKGFSNIVNQITRNIKREQRKNTFKYVQDSSQSYVRWTVEQLCVLLFAIFWAFFSIAEFTLGIADKNESLLGEAFHSFFHCLGSALSLFCLCYTYNEQNVKDHWYPYGKRKLNILAGFVNGLNTIFSAFFVLVKQSHFLLDEEHHADPEVIGSRTALYTKYILLAKTVISLLMLLRLKRYFIYVTHKRERYIDVKEYYGKELKKWRSKHDNLHSFCLILFHQAAEKLLIFVLNFFGLWPESHARNTLITIVISILTVWVSLPLCTNTFINLVQGLSAAHTELIEVLKKEVEARTQGQIKVVESQFWQLDMSYMVGSMKIQVAESGVENRLNPQEAQADLSAEVKKVFAPFVRELTVETVMDPQL